MSFTSDQELKKSLEEKQRQYEEKKAQDEAIQQRLNEAMNLGMNKRDKDELKEKRAAIIGDEQAFKDMMRQRNIPVEQTPIVPSTKFVSTLIEKQGGINRFYESLRNNINNIVQIVSMYDPTKVYSKDGVFTVLNHIKQTKAQYEELLLGLRDILNASWSDIDSTPESKSPETRMIGKAITRNYSVYSNIAALISNDITQLDRLYNSVSSITVYAPDETKQLDPTTEERQRTPAKSVADPQQAQQRTPAKSVADDTKTYQTPLKSVANEPPKQPQTPAKSVPKSSFKTASQLINETPVTATQENEEQKALQEEPQPQEESEEESEQEESEQEEQPQQEQKALQEEKEEKTDTIFVEKKKIEENIGVASSISASLRAISDNLSSTISTVLNPDSKSGGGSVPFRSNFGMGGDTKSNTRFLADLNERERRARQSRETNELNERIREIKDSQERVQREEKLSQRNYQQLPGREQDEKKRIDRAPLPNPRFGLGGRGGFSNPPANAPAGAPAVPPANAPAVPPAGAPAGAPLPPINIYNNIPAAPAAAPAPGSPWWRKLLDAGGIVSAVLGALKYFNDNPDIKCVFIDLGAISAIYGLERNIINPGSEKNKYSEAVIVAIYYGIVRRLSNYIINKDAGFKDKIADAIGWNSNSCKTSLIFDTLMSLPINQHVSSYFPEFQFVRSLEFLTVSVAMNLLDDMTNIKRLFGLK